MAHKIYNLINVYIFKKVTLGGWCKWLVINYQITQLGNYTSSSYQNHHIFDTIRREKASFYSMLSLDINICKTEYFIFINFKKLC